MAPYSRLWGRAHLAFCSVVAADTAVMVVRRANVYASRLWITECLSRHHRCDVEITTLCLQTRKLRGRIEDQFK
jgi:hypothetical protein